MNDLFDTECRATTFAGRMAAPFRRLVHRLLRPTFDQLQRVLRELIARQDADRTRIEALERQVAALQARLEACRPLLTDYLAVTHRLTMVEDRLLTDLAGHLRAEGIRRAA